MKLRRKSGVGPLLFQGGDGFFRLLNVSIQVGDGVETVILEKAIVRMELDHVLHGSASLGFAVLRTSERGTSCALVE